MRALLLVICDAYRLRESYVEGFFDRPVKLRCYCKALPSVMPIESRALRCFSSVRWHFITSDDPTHGFVDYVNASVAEREGLVRTTERGVYIGVDHETVVPIDGRGRRSVRLESREEYNAGLFVMQLEHAPVACGAWPAFWMFGEDAEHPWPEWGELDIMEWVHEEQQVSTALHTTVDCSQDHLEPGEHMDAVWHLGNGSNATNCYVGAEFQWFNQGCAQQGPPDSIGSGFNAQGGGTYAAEWDPKAGYMRVWLWAMGQEPTDLKEKRPRPDAWGLPTFFYSLDERRGGRQA